MSEPKQDHPDVSIVVPTFREAENLPPLLERIAKTMGPSGRSYEIIIVDDDSQDGSDRIVAELAGQGHPVRIITRVGERGLSSAVVRGLTEAGGDALLCMDADLSHPPEAIPAMLECIETEQADFVIGSRYVPGASTDENWGMFRWLNSKVATLIARPFTPAKDPMAGFFLLPRAVFEQTEQLNPIGYKIGLELMVKCRCRRILEVPIHFADRRFGESKLTFAQQLNYLRHIKRLADFKYGSLSYFLQFCLVGATGMVVDLGTFAGLRWAGLAGWLARVIAILVAMTWNFIWNRRFTFSYSRSSRILGQYIRFAASCSVGAVLSWSIYMVMTTQIGMFAENRLLELLAAFIGIVVGTISNFVLSRYWVFRRLVAPADHSATNLEGRENRPAGRKSH